MLAFEVQMGAPAMANPAVPVLSSSSELDMLKSLFTEYTDASHALSAESNKARLSNLLTQMQDRGIYGNNALALIQKYSLQINWQEMSPELFATFYRFIYFLCREPNKRNVQVGTAVAAWRLVLCGRFRLLDRFCSFVSSHHKASVILEDTWRQVLDFSRSVHEDLSNYDPASAWPVLLDEFVEHVKEARHANRPLVYVNVNTQPLDLLSPWSGRAMTAVSPRSGSKRRPPDILEIADQLQQLPLAASDSRSTAAMSNSGAATSPRVMLTAKRLRMNGNNEFSNRLRYQDTAGIAQGPGDSQMMSASHNAIPVFETAAGAVHSRRTPGGMCGAMPADSSIVQIAQTQQQQQQRQHYSGDFTTGRVDPSTHQAYFYHQHHHHHHHIHRPGNQPPGRAGGQPAGLLLREHGLGVGHMCRQQLQSPSAATMPPAGSNSGMDMSRSPDHTIGLQQQQPHMSIGVHPAGMAQQHHGLLGSIRTGSQLPPCPSPGASSRSGMELARRSMERAHSVNVMMQATVTEALGFLQ